MNEKFELKGEWFLPNTPTNERVFGTLKYDPFSGSTLELFGSFGEMDIITISPNADIILGITNKSKPITLYRNFVKNNGGRSFVVGDETGVPLTIYTVNYILVGAHITSVENMIFDTLISSINYLDEWLEASGFHHLPPEEFMEQRKNKKIKIDYTLPKPIEFAINNTLQGKFDFVTNGWSISVFEKEKSIKQTSRIIFKSSIDLTLEDILKNHNRFQNFLILALYHPTHPNYIELQGEKHQKQRGDGSLQRRNIQLYYSFINKLDDAKIHSSMDMIFGYRHIKDNFQTIISNWYKKHDSLEPAFNLLVEQFYNHKTFSENTFLNLVQALETFHAQSNDHTRIPKKEYDEMKESILKVVDKKYHQWLKEQFNFGNHLHLHSRIDEVVTKYSNSTISRIILNKDKFIMAVKNSRNYYTHYSSDLKKKAIKGQELYYLSERIKALLVCSFLIEVGFESSILEELFKVNAFRKFNHILDKH